MKDRPRGRGEELYTAVAVEQLLSEDNPARPAPSTATLIPSLDDLTPGEFERLCARLLAAQGNRVQQAFRYGADGQSQHGVDVLALCSNSTSRIVMQCKRVKRLQPAHLAEIFAQVERYDLAPGDVFILATSFEAESNNRLLEAWASLMHSFLARGVSCELWDRSHLLELLSHKRRIVKAFFGRSTADSFCDGDDEVRPFAPFETRKVLADSGYVSARNRTVSLRIALPGEENNSPNASGLVSFSRSDLSGIEIGIDSRTLVQWLQWQAYAQATTSALTCPYLARSAGGNVFTAPNVRLELDDQEVEELEWCLRASWPHYRAAVERLDSSWRAARFPKSRLGWSGLHVKLCSVHRRFWTSVRAFIRAHDFEKGDSDWHIFDGETPLLSIYTPVARGGFPAGTHLNLWLGDADSSSGWVDICWTQSSLAGRGLGTGHNADQAHEWLMDRLFPAVRVWGHERSHGWWSRTRARLFGWEVRQAAPLDAGLVTSSAKWRSPGRSLSAPSWGATRRIVQLLQAHFHAYYPAMPVESSMTWAVIRLVGRLAQRAREIDEHYIRSKLGLGVGGVSAEVDCIIAEGAARVDMDHALRALLGIVESKHELPVSELPAVMDALMPVWSRYIEDQLCRTYS